MLHQVRLADRLQRAKSRPQAVPGLFARGSPAPKVARKVKPAPAGSGWPAPTYWSS